ncbi:sensor histidine kinase [Streptomyces sp. NPDC059740]|uniref:sensor histidine kinase n=1 Tax=Streptomyces sp. NPDC059740 TaxID=3346926 RepID=UPI00366638A5
MRQSEHPAPSREPMGRSPEYRVARAWAHALREDLLRDAWQFRPLLPLSRSAEGVRWLPAPLREAARWVPHAAVACCALLVLMVSGTAADASPDSVTVHGPAMALAALLPVAAVALTALRPIAAFWLSVVSAPLVGLLLHDRYEGDWPWPAGVFAAHFVVLTVVTFRTRPRTGAGMWTVTALYSLVVELAFPSPLGTNSPALLLLTATTLLVATVRHVRRRAAQELSRQESATELERSRRALLEERSTIVQELHDIVAHHMSVVAVQAEAAPYRVAEVPAPLEQSLVVIRENAVAALAELRRVLGVVRASDHHLPEAPQPTLADLDDLLDNVRKAGLTVDAVVTGAPRELPPGVELSAYRIVQEASSNVLRHAPDASTVVEVSHVLGGLGLRVVNTCPSTPGTSPLGTGNGLTGMRERVAMLDGRMTDGPTDEGGYEVSVFLPVTPEEDAA